MPQQAVQCPRCSMPEVMEFEHPPVVGGSQYASTVLVSHPKTATCGSCGAKLHLTIAGMQIKFTAALCVETAQPSLIITPQ